MRIENVFIDNGGVITDNGQRRHEFQRLVGRIFVERFGGDADAWEQANVGIVTDVWGRFLRRVDSWDATRDIRDEKALYYADWLKTMFERAGRTLSLSGEECAAAGKEIEDWILPQVVPRFPGADEAIEALAARCRLFTASDGFSDAIAVALGANAAKFERLYGPELVNVPKSAGRRYYDAIFADAGVEAAGSLVIDDGVANLLAARQAGARTVLVSQQPPSGYDGPAVTRLADVASIIEKL